MKDITPQNIVTFVSMTEQSQRIVIVGHMKPDGDALGNDDKQPMIYSLDRILQLTVKQVAFEMPTDWDAEEFFKGCFGVCRSVGIEIVKLKVSASQANYIRDLKLHDSQEEVEHNDKFSIFTYRLRPEYDFQQELLRHGEDVEVLEPQWLREETAGKIERMNSVYKSK